MRGCRAGPVLVLTLSLFVREICTMAPAEREQMRQTVEEMFYHAFDGYMERAFPHDELRPISGGYTDALVELGAPAQPTRRGYSGVVGVRCRAMCPVVQTRPIGV